VAHFFLRAFGVLRQRGVFGLIATNTIGQGDTRATGLATILGAGGSILRATRRLKWPGEAAVVVSVVHVVRGAVHSPVLDSRPVWRISAYLVESDLDTSPEALVANSGKAFQGSIVLGMGFTFDDVAAAKAEAESIATMRALIARDPRNQARIFPYIGGEEINNDSRQAHHRYVINFEDFPLRRDHRARGWSLMTLETQEKNLREGSVPQDYPGPVAEDWPDLIDIVRRLVKPQRDLEKREARKKRWWRFGDRQPGLYSAIGEMSYVLATSRVSPILAICRLPARVVPADSTVTFVFGSFGPFAVLQCRVHELWARSFSSTLEDRLRYAPSDCFRTFPFPENFVSNAALETTGETYHTFRANLMIERNEGLTKTYNRFHDRVENAPDISRLRTLHADIDAAVLRAYSWHDLADTSHRARSRRLQ
jgi:hypothetical protein